MSSAHGIYEKCFKALDTVCCNGEYHLDEIIKLENLYGYKKTFKTGYPYFDFIEQKKKENKKFR